MHIAVIGVGNVGSATAFSILRTCIASELSVVDIKPGLAKAVAEELCHANSYFKCDTVTNYLERDEDLSGADIVIVSAGYPRQPGTKISRRELVGKNAKIIKYIAEVVPPNNRGAKYVIVTNPVDAMAMLFKKVSREEFVISTGTSLETLRFKSILARMLNIPIKEVSGFVGGEHGKEAIILWSTVRIEGIGLIEYLKSKNMDLDKKSIEEYMKTVSLSIINASGATRYGPAAAFTEIVKAIALDENKVLSIASPLKIQDLGEEVFVSIPTIVGRVLGPRLLNWLNEDELRGIRRAAKAIYDTYRKALEILGLGD